MTKTKMMAIGFSIAAVLTIFSQDSRCDVIGSAYSAGSSVFTDGFTAGGAGDDGSPAALTFDGTTKVIGNLNFGNAGDQMIVEETQTLAADGITYTVDIFMLAEDSAGNLTAWAADGTTIDDDGDALTAEVPLALSFFEIAEFDGGTDPLDVIVPAGSTYAFVDSNAFVVGVTTGTVFAFADTADPLDGTDVGVFSAGVGVNAGDISADWAPIGEEVAGYGFTWTYTITAAVPEPGSVTGLIFLGLAGLAFNRRR